MLLKYLGTVVPSQEFEDGVTGISWSPNNLKLAIASSDRSIYLFDENCVKRDRFSTKPIDSKYGKKSYTIKGIAFSPDSTKIAVGQTDCIVYVYNIGEEWGEKKVICNKFKQSSSVTCLIWLYEGPIVVGLADGKVRAAFVKSQKSQTFYASDSPTIALASNVRGTGFLSSHADGSIVRYYLDEHNSQTHSGRICTHPVPAYALSWTHSHVLAAGCDKRITFYDIHGKLVKSFDYSRENHEKDFTVSSRSPSGQSVAVGSWNRIRILDWSPRRSIWEETNSKVLPNFYTATAMCWRKDGCRLVVGGLCGTVEQFETILRKTLVKGSHEVSYVGPNQVIIRSLQSTNRPIIVRSQTSNEIEDIRILGRADKNVVAKTLTTLLLGDIDLNLISEIPWEDKSGNEKFFFEFPGVCLVFASGELIVVEYGKNEPLGSVKTEAANPHVVSVRINERQNLGVPDNKRLAYLLDPRTIRIVDFMTGTTIAMIGHEVRVDWLELSETGHRLLSRDKRARLWLSDDQGQKILLLTGVSFASWVPGSDVVVAQTGQTLAVWYNVDAPEAVNLVSIRGDAVDILREEGRTSIMVEEPSGKVAYLLDEGLIEFGTALHDNDFGRVLLFLEELQDPPQAEAMWENVARNAMSCRQLEVAVRCFAALGDVSCSKFLKNVVKSNEKYSKTTGNDPLSNPDCWAKIAILNGELKTAEAIYLEQNELEEALEMYKKYWKWEDAIELAESRAWKGLQDLRDKHLSWLLESGQSARAAFIFEQSNSLRAVRLYLEARRPGRAARLILSSSNELLDNESLVREVVRILKDSDSFELAGEVLERTSEKLEAIRCYAKAGAFARALDLARNVDPTSVVDLEREWGEHLQDAGHFDAAINHFIEAGETGMSLNAAINAKQWRKALQIIQVIEDNDPRIREQCEKLGEYFAPMDKNLAESLFLRARNIKRAVEVQVHAGNWNRAHELAYQFMAPEEAKEILSRYADSLRETADLRHAEELYVAIGDFDKAIAMYRRSGMRSDMIRLVSKHRPDLLQTTHAHLAKELEANGKAREAEEHFLAANDWKGAVGAYKAQNLWEDAMRVAKQFAGESAAHQVALMWARTLAPELAARLLIRLNYFEPCLQLACEAALFDWALTISKYGLPHQQKDVHYRYAITLEDDGRFSEAEKEFIKAERTMEAVQMYIHIRDWDAAEDVAQVHSQETVNKVLIARATDAVEAQDYSMAESLLLRAHKPEVIIDYYKNAGMWSEALRVCREYLPSEEAALRRELGQKSACLDGANALEESKKWLEVGEVRAAIDILTLDPQAPRSSLIRAADILLHQADPETAIQVGGDLGSRLFSLGEHALAAQVFLQADRLKDAIDSLVAVGEWDRARRIVRELASDMEPYLEEKYQQSILRTEEAEKLAEVDAETAFDTLANKNQWILLFEKAEKISNQDILQKYVARRAAQLLKSKEFVEAIKLFSKYGAPPAQQNFNLYFRLSESILNSRDDSNNYENLIHLRSILLQLCRSFRSSKNSEKFDRLLKVTHYSAVKLACRSSPSLQSLVLKSSISLLRFTDILVADRAYYEAGIEARSAGLLSEAFVFLNHFLDLEECIEEGENNVLDVDDLTVTDFPLEVPLPEEIGVGMKEREEAREWVLAVSMDRKIEQSLPVDHRGAYIGSLTCPSADSGSLQDCVITGYPARGPIIRFEEEGRVADREDWTKLVNFARQNPQHSELKDILAFIRELCGAVPNFSF